MIISAKIVLRIFSETSTLLTLTKLHFRALPTLKYLSVSVRFINLASSISKLRYMDVASVIKVFEEQVPPTLAEKWDNTGLLVEPSKEINVSTIFFTNDLTEDVLQEAISMKCDLIISYHPPIFSPMKSLKQSKWKDRIVINCIKNSIAVYSPHTGCDAVSDGVNDWLINCFSLDDVKPIIQSFETHPGYTHMIEFKVPASINMVDSLKPLPVCQVLKYEPGLGISTEYFKVKVNATSLKHIMELLASQNELRNNSSVCITTLNPLPLLSCGMGRIGKLVEPLSLKKCIEMVKVSLNLNHIRFAQSVSDSLDTPISVVAVCAGSGSSILKGVNADLYITGEMSHHDLLDTIHQNISVILCEHSNSERGYLHQLVKLLSPKLPGIKLIVSSTDKDPITIV